MGGSYSNQIHASSVESCFKKWIKIRLKNEENLLSDKDLSILKNEFDPDVTELVPLKGLTNVWCGDFSIKENYLSITIVETVENE